MSLGTIFRASRRYAARFQNNVSNQIVFDKPETTAKFRKQAMGGGEVYSAWTVAPPSSPGGTGIGAEYLGRAGGIFSPKVGGLGPGDIIYRVAGSRGGGSLKEIARNICGGDWWITPEHHDHMWELMYGISRAERRELFGTDSEMELFLKLWESQLAIGTLPQDPYLVKCLVKNPTGIFFGKGNPVARGYKEVFPVLPGSQIHDQVFIPGNKDEDGNYTKPVFSLPDQLEVLDVEQLK